MSLRPEDDDEGTEAGEFPSENGLTRLGRTDEEDVPALSGDPFSLGDPLSPGDDGRRVKRRHRERESPPAWRP